MSARELITEHLDLWTGAVTKKSSSGRGSNGKVELTGVKKLRELVLELAVRGKLVAQDDTDEPAKDLLSRIAKEKSELILAGRLKKQRALPPISESDTPYSLPSKWTWTRLGNYGADIHYGYTASADEHLSEYRLLRITDIQNDKVNWATVPGCEISKQQAEPYLLSENDILIARTGGTIGKSFLVQDINVNAVFASYLIRLKKLEATYARYVKVFLGSHTYWSQLYEASMGTGQPNVNGKSLKNLLFPVPPMEEQRRIVQKVDELMALCDRLEQQTSDQLEAHETVVDTLLGTLTQSENATELADNWARLAAHFDTLFTTEQSIDKLKQTILQLAVMGRLVEQDAGDEPVATLLQSIESQKGELIKSGAIKHSKPLPPVSQEDHPFRLPNGWRCHRLGALVTKLGSGSTPRGGQRAYVDGGVPFLRSQNVWNDGLRLEDIVYISEDTHARMSNTVVYPKDILLNITGCVFQTKVATDSRRSLPPIPRESCH